MKKRISFYYIYFLTFIIFVISGCQSLTKKPIEAPKDRETRRADQTGKLLGADSLIFGGARPNKELETSQISAVGLRVNPELWHASLSTLNFMPLASSDAQGGLIITDWYTQSKKGTERLKVQVNILSSSLRPSSLKVTVYQQTLKAGQWINHNENDAQTATELENIILEEARRLYQKKK